MFKVIVFWRFSIQILIKKNNYKQNISSPIKNNWKPFLENKVYYIL